MPVPHYHFTTQDGGQYRLSSTALGVRTQFWDALEYYARDLMLTTTEASSERRERIEKLTTDLARILKEVDAAIQDAAL